MYAPEMTSRRRELYNNSFDYVVKQTDISDKITNLEAQRLCRAAKGVYIAAQGAHRGGDEELAYIFYMRYTNVVKSLNKKPDFRCKQAELTAVLGGNKSIRDALDNAAILQKSLIAR